MKMQTVKPKFIRVLNKLLKKFGYHILKDRPLKEREAYQEMKKVNKYKSQIKFLTNENQVLRDLNRTNYKGTKDKLRYAINRLHMLTGMNKKEIKSILESALHCANEDRSNVLSNIK